MCGILGIYSRNSGDFTTRAFEKALSLMDHRGPDDTGVFRDDGVVLGHTRLSIIDLEGGCQPMKSDDGSVVVVYNGEIYNFEEIKKDLEDRGCNFTTRSDTEVLLHAYMEYGVDCVSRFNGMFAFAVLDKNEERLFLARDRMGIKPLYYAAVGGDVYFSSELKPLLELGIGGELDNGALHCYLTYSYIPSPLTPFKNIKKLEPGRRMICGKNDRRVERYWRLEDRESTPGSEWDVKKRIEELFVDSVRKRLIADVPLGVFLSGGIDSSTIVGVMSSYLGRDVKTFSIGFGRSAYNELKYCRIVADRFGTDHNEYKVEADAIEVLPTLLKHIEEPLADASIIPTYYLCKLAREQVTVALSGEGGDETLAGYTRYYWDPKADLYRRIPSIVRKGLLAPLCSRLPEGEKSGLKNIFRRLKKFTRYADLPPVERYLNWFALFNDRDKSELYTGDFAGEVEDYKESDIFARYSEEIETSNPTRRNQYIDINTMLLDDLLLKVDKISMIHSLEVRVPFLDHRFVEYAFNLPSRMKLRGTRSKYILKEWIKDILPEEIVNRGKKGFEVPIGHWFRGGLKDYASDLLLSKQSAERGIFKKSAVEDSLRKHGSGAKSLGNQIFALLVLEIWMREFVDGP